ncbi:MAG: molybdopterin molybdotransferase MoeA [Myxococcales bacterium]|nr:molybdopterin molybdotransferase MoeA [Myxococcales bacterium]
MTMRLPHEALDLVMSACEALGAERVPIEQAFGRIAAGTLHAREDSPPFDHSAMDGYAVRADDLRGASEAAPRVLRVVAEVRAGGRGDLALRSGEAARIFTGAPLPAGADAVVMQEDTVASDGEVRVRLEPRPGQHVRRRGEDLSAGAVAVEAGAYVGPAEIGLLASQRYARCPVVRRPRVAIVPTGDELCEVGDAPSHGRIVDSNTYALAAQVREAGAVPSVLPVVADDEAALDRALGGALDVADMVITSGGVSVGTYDLVQAAMARVGVRERFWKVAIKPGKPVWFGVRGRVPVFGLPGNPVSAMVIFEAFVRPALRRLQGDPRPYKARVRVALAAGQRHRQGRLELLRVRLSPGPALDSPAVATPHPRQGSGALTGLVGMDALAFARADVGDLAPGDHLDALPLGPAPRTATPHFEPPDARRAAP